MEEHVKDKPQLCGPTEKRKSIGHELHETMHVA